MARRRSGERLVAPGEAARSLGISLDTLRRWDRDGRIRVERDRRGRRQVPVSELERLSGRTPRPLTGARLSARNRLPGVVRSVVADGVMALVEVESGPFTLVAAITRDSVEELSLAEGVPVVATVKATCVMVSREGEPG
jgi:molybdopterin-binding protein